MSTHQYLHTAKYGNPGGAHTMKPMFVKRDDHIYKSEYHPDVIADKAEGEKAMYHVRENKIYASAAHPDGPSAHAIFTISGSGAIHTTHDNPGHKSDLPVYILGEKPSQEFIEKTIQKEAPKVETPKKAPEKKG